MSGPRSQGDTALRRTNATLPFWLGRLLGNNVAERRSRICIVEHEEPAFWKLAHTDRKSPGGRVARRRTPTTRRTKYPRRRWRWTSRYRPPIFWNLSPPFMMTGAVSEPSIRHYFFRSQFVLPPRGLCERGPPQPVFLFLKLVAVSVANPFHHPPVRWEMSSQTGSPTNGVILT